MKIRLLIKNILKNVFIYIFEDTSNGLWFKIDETNPITSLFNVDKCIKEVIIPRTVEYESIEYESIEYEYT